ncbi:MAG: sugar transferase [Deltaproteobacteria bacterium]|nr:MAG: sugar transferase [Deltaproteobacteria bacterium]
MSRNFRFSLSLYHMMTDALLVGLCWCLAFALRQQLSGGIGWSLPSFGVYLQVLPLIVMTWLLSCWFFGLYRRTRLRTGLERTRDLLKSSLLGWLLTTAIAFYLKEYSLGRTVVLLSGVLNLFALSGSWFLFFRLERRAKQLQKGQVRSLILGANTNGIRLLQKLEEHPVVEYQTVGFLDPDPERVQANFGNRPVLGTLDALRNVVEEHKVDEVMVALPNQDHNHVFPLVLSCEDLGVGFWMLTNDFEALNRDRDDIPRIDGLPLNYIGIEQTSPLYNITKRLFDVVTASTLLILSAPFWLWWSLRIKMDSKGPVLFVQDRVGYDGKLFRMYKFRTMSVESNPYQEAPRDHQDNRITPYGRFMRRTSIDEVPQLINVLKGEMSLVGPRPEMPFIVDTYEDWQRCRLRVKPGLTGLWQVLGRKDLPMQDNLQYDFYYIRNQSFLLDLSILFRTFSAVFGGKGAY